MKITQSISLYYQTENSDKVYIIEQYKVGEDQFIVNFRFGRRGLTLREGTKTPLPVSKEKADRIFTTLLREKSQKGYRELPESNTSSQGETLFPAKEGEDAREKAILKRLNAAIHGEEMKSDWSLSRVVWRAGELKLQSAEKALLQLCSTVDETLIYSLIWTLSRLASQQAEAFYLKWKDDPGLPSHIHRLASAALLKTGREDIRKAIEDQLSSQLSIFSQKQILSQQPHPQALLIRYLLKDRKEEYALGLYELLSELSLQSPPYRTSFRYIFKLAEWQDDAPFWALIAHKLERAADLKTENAPRAYGKRTRSYLLRRLIRKLERLGGAADPNYVQLASHLLLSFDDELDAQKPDVIERLSYSFDQSSRRFTPHTQRIHFDKNARYLSFFYILFAHSSRYELNAQQTAWICTEGYIPGAEPPPEREEAFPELWDQAGDILMQLLQKAKAAQVHAFATKAILANPALDSLLTLTNVKALFASSFADIQELALGFAKRIYRPDQPSTELVLAMMSCQLEAAWLQARAWVNEEPQAYFSDDDFLIDLLLLPEAALHSWLRDSLADQIFSDKRAISICERLFQKVLLEFRGNEEPSLIIESLKAIFDKALSHISLELIQQFLDRDDEKLKILGASILIHTDIPASSLPESIFQSLLGSDSSALRVWGIRLFSKLDKAQLATKQTLLLQLCEAEEAEIRASAQELTASLLAEKSPEAKRLAFQLLELAYSSSQEIGATYLIENLDISSQSMEQIIAFGKHELLSLRQFCQAYFRNHVARIKYEREIALNILDTDWPDTQQFAFDFFQKEFEAKDWTTDLLISLCDSVRPEVQAFGQKMITHFFEEKDGPEYLLKLSEHPAPAMQLFASNFLDRYADQHIDRLESLKPFFITVLSTVNQNRAAKVRVLAFLKKQATNSPEAAMIVHQIMDRLLGTASKGDKSEYLLLLMAIYKQFPHLDKVWNTQPVSIWKRH